MKSEVYIIGVEDVKAKARVTENGLKLRLWSTNMQSKISSMIGKPLFTNIMIAQSRLAYARVCVEIGVTLKSCLLGNLMVLFLNHDEYEWIPTQ